MVSFVCTKTIGGTLNRAPFLRLQVSPLIQGLGESQSPAVRTQTSLFWWRWSTPKPTPTSIHTRIAIPTRVTIPIHRLILSAWFIPCRGRSAFEALSSSVVRDAA